MNQQTSQGAETLATDALIAVIGDEPYAARTALTGASFRDLALIVAWADELGRLSRQAQTDYENRERREWREADRPVTADERQKLDDVLMEHLLSCLERGDGWTDLRDLVLLAAPHTDAGTKGVRDWAEGQLRDLTQGGVLSPKSSFEEAGPDEYRVVSVPGRDNAG